MTPLSNSETLKQSNVCVQAKYSLKIFLNRCLCVLIFLGMLVFFTKDNLQERNSINLLGRITPISNQSNSTFNHGKFFSDFFMVHKNKYINTKLLTDFQKNENTNLPPEIQPEIDLAYLQKFIGNYKFYYFFSYYQFEITIQDHVLYAKMPGYPIYELLPIKDNEFSIVNSTENYTIRFLNYIKDIPQDVQLIRPLSEPFGAHRIS